MEILSQRRTIANDDSHYLHCLMIGFWIINSVAMQNCKTLLLFEQMAYFIMHCRVTLQNIQMLLGFQKYFFIHMHMRWNPKMDNVILIHSTSKDANIVNNSNDMIFIKDNTTVIVTLGLIDIENVEKSDNSNVTHNDFQAKSIETNALNCNYDTSIGQIDEQVLMICNNIRFL